ncbi:MAG TPA: hypothetical protein VFI24_12350 [Pyrinomonadaceae bacterium]|nr:hypothetical protein [Pyrinomonadaceae bacterium]
MTSHSSATARHDTPRTNRTTRTNTIMNALKRRAQAVLNDQSIDPENRAVLRHALETNDPWLARLVQAQIDEEIIEAVESELPGGTGEDDSSRKKVEALADIICSGGEEAAAALFVLMEALQISPEPKALAHVVKHLAFTRCGELNAFGIVDSQLAVLERELFA